MDIQRHFAVYSHQQGSSVPEHTGQRSVVRHLLWILNIAIHSLIFYEIQIPIRKELEIDTSSNRRFMLSV